MLLESTSDKVRFDQLLGSLVESEVLDCMRDRRNSSSLLPKKLFALRTFLTVGQVELAASLNSDIVSQSGRPYNIKPGRISDYEDGLFEPNLLVLIAYARLGKVHLELLADDRFTLHEFREQLGNKLVRKVVILSV